MTSKISELVEKGIVVTDGAWGTEMQNRGLSRGECPDSWNLTNPEKVEEVARLYVDSGSRVILTNTFGANRFVLGKFDLSERAAEINTRGVEISRRAAGDSALVFSSIGPSGKLLMTGEVTEDELRDAFTEQARAQSEAGADAILIETMMDIEEALIAISAARSTGLPVIASMVFDSGKEKDRTMMGNTPEQMVEAFTQAGVDAVGTNCGQGIAGFIPLCRRIRAATDLPVWIKPNAGLPEIVEGEVVYNTTPEEFASYIPDLVQAGASFIGGCCGTNDMFISEIIRVLGS